MRTMIFDKSIINIGELLLMENNGPIKGSSMQELSIIHNAAIGIIDNKVAWIGKMKDMKNKKSNYVIDAKGKLVTPGLIDSHTHLVFDGSREKELILKQKGASYLEILNNGGGILSTVNATREASKNQLINKSLFHLDRFLSYGVTTVEAKSGYGLAIEAEIKQLKVVQELNKQHPIDIVSTFLGAHTIPPKYTKDSTGYLSLLGESLELIKHNNLADYVDITVEDGMFSIDESRYYLEKAKDLGFGLKMHCEQFSSIGAIDLAVDLKATSVDHLEVTTTNNVKLLANSNMVGVLLPGVSFYLDMQYANARNIIDYNGAIALSTDFNPGSCVTENLQLIMSIAALKMNLSPSEIWHAVTVNAAHAIGKGNEAGAIMLDRPADIVIWEAQNHMYIPYHFGVNHTNTVIKNGEIVYER